MLTSPSYPTDQYSVYIFNTSFCYTLLLFTICNFFIRLFPIFLLQQAVKECYCVHYTVRKSSRGLFNAYRSLGCLAVLFITIGEGE